MIYTEVSCPRCEGSGRVFKMVGHPPDDYWEEEFECADCEGTGVVLEEQDD